MICNHSVTDDISEKTLSQNSWNNQAGKARKPRARLTDKFVEGLPYAESHPYHVRDTLTGFFVSIGKRTKSFKVQCDLRDDLGIRHTKKVHLGHFGDLTISQARYKALLVLGSLQSSGEFKKEEKQWTLGQAWEHMKSYELARKGTRPRTIKGYEQIINSLMGSWINVKLRKFAEHPRLVEERHYEITLKNGPYSANHFGRTFRRLYRYAHAKLDRNLPALPWGQIITWNREARDSSGMDEKELANWFVELAMVSNGIRRSFHLFTLLSGSRPEALSRAKWSDLDLHRKSLRIPEPKGGPERSFTIPLSRPMIRCLVQARQAGRTLSPERSATWIFPSNGSAPGHIVEWKEDRAKLGKWGKQLRQAYVIAAETIDISERTLKRLLNHKSQDVTMGYGDRERMWPRLLVEQDRISKHIMSFQRSSSSG